MHALRRILKDLRENASDSLKEHKSERANPFWLPIQLWCLLLYSTALFQCGSLGSLQLPNSPYGYDRAQSLFQLMG